MEGGRERAAVGRGAPVPVLRSGGTTRARGRDRGTPPHAMPGAWAGDPLGPRSAPARSEPSRALSRGQIACLFFW